MVDIKIRFIFTMLNNKTYTMKYEITDNTKTITHPITNEEVTLRQVKALKSFTLINGREVKEGDLGGWVESSENLSQEGTCWIYDECCMFDNAIRSENSIGFERSMQFGESMQFGNSRQHGDSRQFGDSRQYGCSRQHGNSHQFGKSRQFGESLQIGSSQQFGESCQTFKSKQEGTFKHSYGFHLSCSKSGRLTKNKELIEFNNVGENCRTINYDKTTKLINVNNCFVGNVDELEVVINEKYGTTSNYHDIIKMVRLMESN